MSKKFKKDPFISFLKTIRTIKKDFFEFYSIVRLFMSEYYYTILFIFFLHMVSKDASFLLPVIPCLFVLFYSSHDNHDN
jgi:hypothetical protein